MVRSISAENIAIIESIGIELEPGLTAITGETGAGKSLLVDSIELALGARADTTLLRAGAASGCVSIVVETPGDSAQTALFQEHGIIPENGTVIIYRELSAEGRSQCRIQGRPTAVGILREIGSKLVDLHGQHDHQSLLDPATHVGFLDLWIGADAGKCLSEVRSLHAIWSDLESKLRMLETGVQNREHRNDLLRYQVTEISSALLRPDEWDELHATIARLSHRERLIELLSKSLGHLAEEDGSALTQIKSAAASLHAAVALDPSLGSATQELDQSMYSLEEALTILRSIFDSLDTDPKALDTSIERLDVLKTLRRKYGVDEKAVLAYADQAERELELLLTEETSLEDLRQEISDAWDNLIEAASRLTQLRTDRSPGLSQLVADQLRDLAMERAQFEIRITSKPLDCQGADLVEFLFSANVGEPLKPLSKIASGGEISRVMLALKVTLAGRAGVPTMIFDEVDAGLGGRAAAIVANKLKTLSQFNQVIVITHLPQIAGRADHHFRIEKVVNNERTICVLQKLEAEERVAEIARMIAGETITEAALLHARNMLNLQPTEALL